jgi:hypothetical protein
MQDGEYFTDVGDELGVEPDPVVSFELPPW